MVDLDRILSQSHAELNMERKVAWRSLDDAEADLSQFYQSFVDELDAAFAEFREETRRIAPRLHPRTQAEIIRDLTVRRMREWCDRTGGAEFIAKGQLGVIGLVNNWIVRVKKMNLGFKVAVSPTEASEAYDRNEVPASIEGLFQQPPATCLYLAWFVPENAPTRIGKFLICNDERGSRSWVRALDDGSVPPPAELDLGHPPLPPPTPPAEPRRVRVRTSVNGNQMSEKFNGRMLALARQWRRASQFDLVTALNGKIAQGTLSKIEHGRIQPDDHIVNALADALQVQRSFFFDSSYVREPMISYHRKRQALSSTDLQSIQAKI